MASIERKALDQPDETRPIEKGMVEIVKLDAGTVMRTILRGETIYERGKAFSTAPTGRWTRRSLSQ